MANNFGMKIYNDDGTSFIFDENCSVCKILGVFKYWPTDANGYNRKTGIYVPDDYQIAIGFSCQSKFFTDISSGYQKYGGLTDMSYYLDENRQVILKPGERATGWGLGATIGEKQDCMIFAWPQSNKGNYGLSFNGYDNFSSITDVSEFSFVAFKGEIEITPSGWVPSSIDSSFNFDNTVMFFHWENADISLVKYYKYGVMWGEILDRKYLFYDKNGNVYSGTVKTKIVIFSNTDLKQSKYGVRIYGDNESFFEINNSILIRPTFYSMGQHELYEFKNIPNIKRPMILPTTIGGYSKGWNIDRAYCTLGIANNGYQLAPSPVRRESVYYNRFDARYEISNYPVLILDAESYFNFGD